MWPTTSPKAWGAGRVSRGERAGQTPGDKRCARKLHLLKNCFSKFKVGELIILCHFRGWHGDNIVLYCYEHMMA